MGKSIELDELRGMELSEMKAGQMKKELKLRGVDTTGLFEKSDLLEKLRESRTNNVERIDQFSTTSAPAPTPAPNPAPIPSPPQSSVSNDVSSVSSMRVSELKAELDSYGIAYNDLFEKSEFVERVRMCRSEGREKKVGTASSTVVDEVDDGEWKDVETTKMGSGGN
eukprot:CAMPEP_0118661790 /NCGR_PEP_ID=MMETSP0785-20121206/16478_1 /TAXON_ID=91992 /ORGANISM="Bolidomonas pacifica, Strain CCMP 1866" /LENGTH=166 /DNA_ID=CAMNT_0006555275 /DNA_START=146 /DNA_END=643 /DNA_ORIENTATION=+